MAARMAIMRDELAPCGSSPLEVLLAERAALCWLHVQLMEYEAIAYAGDLANISDSIKAREMDRRAEVVDRRLAHAQSRYVQALTALAKVRKLITPVVIGQLNVSESEGGKKRGKNGRGGIIGERGGERRLRTVWAGFSEGVKKKKGTQGGSLGGPVKTPV